MGAWEVLGAVAGVEDAPLVRTRPPANGARRGWWGMSQAAEGFLDQLVTWRELGLNLQSTWPDFASYASLPEWARRTLAAHASDERPALYDLRTLEAAETHDDIWNAAQRELVREGRMQNYLRMLWGKNILRWTQAPEEAYERCLHLNDKYALDGRDPNSLTGISWVFGRYDRPWGPEREVFGTVRTMTSDSTRRKLHLKRVPRPVRLNPRVVGCGAPGPRGPPDERTTRARPTHRGLRSGPWRTCGGSKPCPTSRARG